MTGHVYIIGQIGSDEKTKGVELQDVVQQLEPLKNFDEVFVHINSPGGYVGVGNDIHDYIASFSNVKTIAENYCASIATKIHLAVPVQNRFIEEGCEYMVHNPLLDNVSGNAEQLIAMGESIKPIQKELVNTYIAATGMSKAAVEGLMNQETTLTSEQAISLGFASKILPKAALKAVAFYEQVKTKTENKMSEEKSFMEKVKSLFKEKGIELEEKVVFPKNTKMLSIKGKEALAVMLPSDGGNLETPFADLMVGDPAMLEGMPAPAGTYKLEDGTEIVVDENGNIAEINNPSELISSLTLAKSTAEEKVTSLEAELQALKAENETLKSEQNEVLAKLKAVGGTFVPEVKAHAPQKPAEQETKSMKELMAERAAMYKTKK